MKHFWEDTYDTGYDEDLLSQLARLLFMNRKRVESADASQLGLAFASQQETWRAIRDVLELRQIYLKSKGIEDLRHVLTSAERAELTKRVRAEYENSEEQRALQDTDVDKGKAKGKGWEGKWGSWQRQGEEQGRCARFPHSRRSSACDGKSHPIPAGPETEAVVSALATGLRHEADLGDLGIHWPL